MSDARDDLVEQLLPCPFCGEKQAFFVETEGAYLGRSAFHVACHECEAASFGSYCMDKVSAVTEWNTRSGEPDAATRIQQLTARVGELEADLRLQRSNGYKLLGGNLEKLTARAEAAEASLAEAERVIDIVDADVRHHLRSDAVTTALIRPHAIRAARGWLDSRRKEQT